MSSTSPARPKIIRGSVLLYRGLLALGPGAFRRDYSIPALQDFRQCLIDAHRKRGFFGVIALWPLLFGEALSGLLAAYSREFFGRKQAILPTIRRSMIAAFWAFVLFGIAIIALGRITDPAAPFDAVGRVHPEVGVAYSIIVYSWEIALLAIMLGGLPILFVALKRAIPGGQLKALQLFAIKRRHALVLLGDRAADHDMFPGLSAGDGIYLRSAIMHCLQWLHSRATFARHRGQFRGHRWRHYALRLRDPGNHCLALRSGTAQ